MTTAVGIWTPEGIVLASDTLKVKGEIVDGKVRIIERTRGYRKISASYEQNSLVVYACQLGFPQHLEWLEDIIGEIMQTGKTETIPAQFREAVSKVLRTDELVSLEQYGRSVTEFHGLLACLDKNKHNLIYQYLAHPSEVITNYKSIGSGSDYAAPLLRECKSLTEAVQVAESAINEASRHRKSLSRGISVYTLTSLEGAKEIKFIE